MYKGKGISIEKLVELYKLSNQAEGKSQRTIDWYSYILTAFSQYAQQRSHLKDISVFNIDNIRRYILELRRRRRFEGHPYTRAQDKLVSSETVQGHVRGLKAFSTWLHIEGYTESNRLENLKVPKAVSKVIEPLTLAEQERILATARSCPHEGVSNHAIVLTLLDTGLRESELANISITNLNLDGGYIKVLGKGAKERVVPIGVYCQGILRN